MASHYQIQLEVAGIAAIFTVLILARLQQSSSCTYMVRIKSDFESISFFNDGQAGFVAKWRYARTKTMMRVRSVSKTIQQTMESLKAEPTQAGSSREEAYAVICDNPSECLLPFVR